MNPPGVIDAIWEIADRVLARHGLLPKSGAAGGAQPQPQMTGAFMEKELQTNPFTIPATVAECQELAFKLGEERAKIDLALSQSMVNEKQRGIPPNWDWIGRARYAHKLKGIQIARLNGKISELRQAEKKSMAEAFLMATQEIFDQADLQDVWDLVHQRHPEFRREVALG